MRTNGFHYLILSVVLVQVGCGGETSTAPKSVQTKSVPVAVLAARYETVPSFMDAPGTVQARNRIALSSQINGFVREMSVRVGDIVRPGQVLARLDARDAESQKALSQASIEEAQAGLGEARKGYQAAVEMRAAAKAQMQLSAQTFDRYQKLFAAKSVSPQELDEVRARRDASAAEVAARDAMVAGAEERIRQVEAKIQQAKAQSGRTDIMIGWTEIKAPAAGRIMERQADTGTAIFPGSPLLVLESMERPQVIADLPTENSGALRAGMEVQVRNPDGKTSVTGRVSEIVPQASAATHTVQFKVDLPAGSSLPHGQFVRVEIPTGSRNVLLVPRRALRETGQLTGLFIADNSSKARFRLVKVEPYDAERVQVLAGVDSGEKVITSPSDQITDGVSVEIRS
jgi:HlyD family secretion protein